MRSQVRGRIGWRTAIVMVAVAALLVRLLIIAHSRGGEDLRIYTYFARLGLHGHNPFAAPAGGAFPAVKGDNPPVEIALFAGLLALHDSPTTLRVLFASADAAVLLVLGLCFRRPQRWRMWFVLFYAFNPFVLVAWTGFAEDKTLVFLGIVILLLGLERGREWLSWTAAIVVTALKFIGAFALPVLAVYSFRRHRWRALVPVGTFVVCFGASYLLWFPKSVDTLTRRNGWLNVNPPIHASPTMLLARLGIYAPFEARLFTAVALLAVFAWFAARRINVEEAVVWSVFAGSVFLPNNSFSRILLFTLPFIFIVEMSTWRWAALWVVSTAAGVGAAVATRGVPHIVGFIAGPLHTIFAHEATIRHVLWVNAPLALLLAFYWIDRTHHLRGSPADGSTLRADSSDTSGSDSHDRRLPVA